jgi:hypothetical protein
LAPSGSPLAATYPGAFGSRVGGVGRAGWAIAGFKINIAQSNAAPQVVLAIFIFILSCAGGITFNQPKNQFAVITKLQLAGNFDGRSLFIQRFLMQEKTGSIMFIP